MLGIISPSEIPFKHTYIRIASLNILSRTSGIMQENKDIEPLK